MHQNKFQMTTAIGGFGSPPPLGGGQQLDRTPADRMDALDVPQKFSKSRNMASSRRWWEEDEEEFGRSEILANRKGGKFPTSDYSWSTLTKKLNEFNVGKTYSIFDQEAIPRTERTQDAVEQHFRSWWRRYCAADSLSRASIAAKEDVSYVGMLFKKLSHANRSTGRSARRSRANRE